MNQRGSMATVVLLFAAILGASYIPRRASEPVKSEAPVTAAVHITPHATASGRGESASTPVLTDSCEQIRQRLTRFYPSGMALPVPDECYATGPAPGVGSPAATKSVSFAIAIVPNPVQTHLPLMFDRQIDAIQQAIQDTGFTYDTSWFPWDPSDASQEQPSAELREQPGVMVFRGGTSDLNPFEHGLVIFVVAEQPTGGLSDSQFAHAVNWISRLQPAAAGLRIIGPTFSGSLASLARELRETDSPARFSSITIFSGTANADENVNWFKDFLAAQEPDPRNPKFKFRTFEESDALMTDRFLCYMQHEGYDLNHFAILSEDETAFGKASSEGAAERPRCSDHVPRKNGKPEYGSDGKLAYDRSEGTPIYLYYPRDIATLRSAYEQQGIFSAGKPQAGAPSTSLKADLSEPSVSKHDTVRSYAGQLTPQAQEAALYGISNILDNKHVEFVIIRGTNTLDQLFLSEFLRRTYPSGRVVIDGADLMFRRGMEGASLRGVMLLSSYPLLGWTHDAVPPIDGARGPSYRVFPQDLSEGTYIAARELLAGVPGAAPSVSISDYAPPLWALESGPGKTVEVAPPTWVTVVGHRQFWPLAVLNQETEVSGSHHESYAPVRTKSVLETVRVKLDAGPPGRTGLPGEMWALVLLCLIIALSHCYLCVSGSIFRAPRMRADFAPIPRKEHTWLIFAGSLCVAFLAVPLAFSVYLGSSILPAPTVAGLGLILVTMIVSAFLGFRQNCRLPIISGENTPKRTERLEKIRRLRRRLQLLWFPALLIYAAVHYYLFDNDLGTANTLPGFWRAVYLRSGVSGLLPQVLLIFGLYLWYRLNLHGLAMFGDDRPVLPKVDDLPQFEVPANTVEEAHGLHTRLVKFFRIFSQEGAGANIEAEARPLGRRYRRSLLWLGPISYAVLWLALGGPSLRTLGDIKFGIAIFLGVGACIGLILADTYQLLNAWSQLRQLLIFLDRTRLRRTLSTLRGLYGGSVWRLSGNALEERYRLISRQLESLRALHHALTEWQTGTPDEIQRKQIALHQVEQCESDSRRFTIWYVDLLNDEITDAKKEYDITPLTDFQHMLAATAGCLMKLVILPEWQSDPNSMIRVSESKDTLDTGYGKQVAALPAHVSAAEELFLLPYMGFVQNILARVRTIALGIVTLFIAATLGVSSYPFDPLPVIGAIFVIVFAIVGVSMLKTYAEMSRDATLSRIANTTPGELGLSFWVKMAALGAGPLLGLLTTLFPSMTDFIVSFLQPGAQALK